MNVTMSRFDGVSFAEMEAAIDFVQKDVTVFGKTVPQPRLVAWYGPRDYSYSGSTLPAARMPVALEAIAKRLSDQLGVQFDSVMCNLYRSGSDSVGWHADDEPIFGDDPVIASISLGETRRFVLRENATGEKTTWDLEDGSLLVMGEGVQANYQHSVPKTKRNVGPRINLTFRKVV